MNSFDMITSDINREFLSVIDEGCRMLLFSTLPVGVQQINRAMVFVIPNSKTYRRSRFDPTGGKFLVHGFRS